MSETLDRATLRTLARHTLSRPRNWSKAEVYTVRTGGREVVIKDMASRPWLLRRSLGRWLLAREARAYIALAGLPGIPALVGRPDPYALAIEKIDGPSLRSLRGQPVNPDVFSSLAVTLEAIHRRGVALADLHHRNVLLADDRPYLVDLAMAVARGSGRNPLRRWIVHHLQRLDQVALLRMKRRFLGHLTAVEEAFLSRAGRAHRLGRALKRMLNLLRLGRHAEKPP